MYIFPYTLMITTTCIRV